MTTWSNTTSSGVSSTPGQQPLVVAGNGNITGYQGFVFFAPNARDLVQYGGGSNTVVQEAQRTSTTCYMRGLSEHLRLQTSSAVPWLWRRITFCSRDINFRQYLAIDTPTTTTFNWVETSNGYKRTAINQNVNNSTNTQNNLNEIIFKGAQGIDWVDIIVAQVDTRRIDLKSDKTCRIVSGNQSGTMREFKLWHAMNKNMVYSDDETGEAEATSVWSVTDKRGMGDFYVLDLFASGLGGTSTDLLAVQYNSSLYWHEK